MKHTRYHRGFTLIELIISLAIMVAVGIVLSKFQADVFDLNYTLRASLGAQLDGRNVVKIMVTELRKASQSATGTYPIAVAGTTTITFFSDVNGDGTQDQVRYFLSGTTLKRGVIAPTGSPAAYVAGNEVVTTLISSVVASSTLPIFQYYPGSYAGTSTPLAQPVNISSIRLVQVTVIIDSNPNRSPTPLIVTSQVMLRNLKDNL